MFSVGKKRYGLSPNRTEEYTRHTTDRRLMTVGEIFSIVYGVQKRVDLPFISNLPDECSSSVLDADGK